jgi:2-polyprenyl-6-methoxyphenol hydroxylase-like FAD-dependent oxidoreductase
VDLSYTTRTFRLDRTHIDGDLFVFTAPTPESRRGGALGVMENGVGVVTLYGLLGERPPAELDGFREFARSLAQPDTYDIVKDREPVGEAATLRFPASTRRRYERLRDVPAGLLVLGDALGSFNPVYGQGMAVAALQAGRLARLAATDPVVDPRRFFRAVAPVVDAAWQIVTGGDLAYPQVEGRRNPVMPLLNRYLQRLQAAAVRDAALSLAFGRVANLLAGPPSLLRPDRAVRVLVHGR